MATALQETPLAQAATRLQTRLRDCGRGTRRLQVWLALEKGIASIVGLLLLLLLLDALCVLPAVLRAMILLVGGSVGSIALGRGWQRWREAARTQAGPDAASLRWLPVSSEALRSGQEFAALVANSRMFGSLPLQEALVTQLAERLRWDISWPYWRVQGLRRLTVFLLLLGLFLAIIWTHPGSLVVSLRRIFFPLRPNPFVTVQVESLAYGAKGRPYPLRATVSGWPVQEAIVEWEEGPEWQQLIVPVDGGEEGPGRIEAELPARGSFRYRLRARDALLTGRVRMIDPPTLPPGALQVTIHPPRYTGQGVVRLEQPGLMEAVQGSTLQFQGHVPPTVQKLWLTLNRTETTQERERHIEILRETGSGRFQCWVDTQTLSAGEWSCTLYVENTEGLRSSYRYSLLLTTDPPPKVTLDSPAGADTLLVPPEGWLPVQVKAEDKRYGLQTLYLFMTRPHGAEGTGRAALLQWLGSQLRRHTPFDAQAVPIWQMNVEQEWQRSLVCSSLAPGWLSLAPLILWEIRPTRWEWSLLLPAGTLAAVGGVAQVEAVAVDNSLRSSGMAWSSPLSAQLLSEQLWRQRRTAQLQHWGDRVRALQVFPRSLLAMELKESGAELPYELLALQQEWARQVNTLAREFSTPNAAFSLSLHREEALETCLAWRLRQMGQLLTRTADSQEQAHHPWQRLRQRLPLAQQQFLLPLLRQEGRTLLEELQQTEQTLASMAFQEQALATLGELAEQLRSQQTLLTISFTTAQEEALGPEVEQRLRLMQEEWPLLWQQGRRLSPPWPEPLAAQRCWSAWQEWSTAVTQRQLHNSLIAGNSLQRELQNLRESFQRQELVRLQAEIAQCQTYARLLQGSSPNSKTPPAPILRPIQAMVWQVLAQQLARQHQETVARWLEQATTVWLETGDTAQVADCWEAARLTLAQEILLREHLLGRLRTTLLWEQCLRQETDLEGISVQAAACLRLTPEEKLSPSAGAALAQRQQAWSVTIAALRPLTQGQPWQAAALERLGSTSREAEAMWQKGDNAGPLLLQLREMCEQLRKLLRQQEENAEFFSPEMPERPVAPTNRGAFAGGPILPQRQGATLAPVRLPPHLRRELEQYAQERFPPRYAEECARYYRTLLEMHRPPGK